jgi:hypothetical protein
MHYDRKHRSVLGNSFFFAIEILILVLEAKQAGASRNECRLLPETEDRQKTNTIATWKARLGESEA